MATFSHANRIAPIVGFFLLSAVGAIGQQPATSQSAEIAASGVRDSNSLIPGDLVDIRVLNLPELDQSKLRVTDSGEIPLLLLGPIKIEGLTPGEAGKAIAAAYIDRHVLRNAHVSVTLEDSSYAFHSATVFGYVAGATGSGTNGISIPLPAPKPLLQVLAMAGGLSDRASHTVTIQRRDPDIKPFKVLIPNDPDAALANDVMVYPGDTVVVPRAGIVYVLGNVGTPHGQVMQEDGKITLLQALSQAGSPLPPAGLSKVMIFRKENGQYQQIPVNVGQMVKGKIPDMQLVAEDVVWVPFSIGKNLLVNAAGIVSSLGAATTSAIIYTH